MSAESVTTYSASSHMTASAESAGTDADRQLLLFQPRILASEGSAEAHNTLICATKAGDTSSHLRSNMCAVQSANRCCAYSGEPLSAAAISGKKVCLTVSQVDPCQGH